MKISLLANKDIFISSLKESGVYVSSISKYITSYLVLSDNSKIILANDQGHLTIWCLATFSFLKSLEVSDSSINSISEIIGSTRIVTSTFSSEITLIDAVTFEKISQFSFKIPIMHLKGLNGKLYIMSSLGKLSIFEVESLQILNEFNTRNFTAFEFDICDVNKLIVFACRNKMSLVYSLESFKKVAQNSHLSAVTTICISSVFEVYVSGEADGAISLFDLKKNLLLYTLKTGNALIRMKFMNEDNHIITLSTDNNLGVLTTNDLNIVSQSRINDLQITDLKLLKNESKIACLSQDGSVRVIKLSNQETIGDIAQLVTSIDAIYSIINTSEFLTISKFGRIRLWKTSEKKSSISLLRKKGIKITKLSKRGRFLIISDNNFTVYVCRTKMN